MGERKGGDCLGRGGEGPEMERLPGRKDFLRERGTQLKGGEEKQEGERDLGA